MIINSRSSNFMFNFPKGFFLPDIEAKYDPYIFRMPGLPWDNVGNMMNANVQSVTFPSLTMDTVLQTRKGKEQAYKSSKHIPDLFSKEMVVSMKTLDGYINYWIFLENALLHLDFSNKEIYFDDLVIRSLSQEGHILQTIRFEKVILTGISEIQLSFSDNNPDFKTFDCTFRYNAIDISVEHD